MACYSGKDGALSVDGTNVAMLQDWTVTQNANVIECSFMGSDWVENKSGLKSWEGSATAYFADDSQAGAGNGITVGSQVALIFYPEDGVDLKFSGNAVVTSIENSAAVGEIVSVSLSFTGTGALATDITI